MGREDIAAHLGSHPLGLQQRVHAQAVHGRQEPLRLCDEGLLGIGSPGAQVHDQAPDDGRYSAVASLGFGCEDGFDAGGMPECHPYARIDGEFFIQGQELAQKVQYCSLLFRGVRRFLFDSCHGGLKPPGNPVNDSAKGKHQEVVAAGKVVPDGAHCQSGFIRHFPEGCPFQAIAGNDPEYGLDNFLAPGFGINNFGHQ